MLKNIEIYYEFRDSEGFMIEAGGLLLGDAAVVVILLIDSL